MSEFEGYGHKQSLGSTNVGDEVLFRGVVLEHKKHSRTVEVLLDSGGGTLVVELPVSASTNVGQSLSPGQRQAQKLLEDRAKGRTL